MRRNAFLTLFPGKSHVCEVGSLRADALANLLIVGDKEL